MYEESSWVIQIVEVEANSDTFLIDNFRTPESHEYQLKLLPSEKLFLRLNIVHPFISDSLYKVLLNFGSL